MDTQSCNNVKNAITALKAHSTKTTQDKPTELLPTTTNLWAIIALKKLPKKARVKPQRLALPTPIVNSPSVCLIVKDAQKKDIKLKVSAWATVISVSKLRKNYKSFEQKRQLCASYDMFMADPAILPILPKLLGKTFFAKKKHPIPFDVSKPDLKAEFEQVCSATFLHLNKGATLAIKIATIDMTTKDAAANYKAAIEGAFKYIDNGFEGVQALHVKTDESTALPVYTCLGENVKEVEE
jgi:ribosome biogenesis protein UTP30